jgi:hypothetical protein
MPKMCELSLPGPKGESAFVNPTTVLYVRAGSTGNTSIYFGDDKMLTVGVPIDTVVRLLDTAMNADHA